MREDRFVIAPAHILKPVHPKYNAEVDYKDFENALPPDALPQVTMGPFAATEYKTDELLIMRRNPYFWQVDETGKQLPYFDEVVYQKGPSGVGRTLCTLAGGCDHTNLENPSTFVETLKRAQEPDAHFDVTWGPELLATPCRSISRANSASRTSVTRPCASCSATCASAEPSAMPSTVTASPSRSCAARSCARGPAVSSPARRTSTRNPSSTTPTIRHPPRRCWRSSASRIPTATAS